MDWTWCQAVSVLMCKAERCQTGGKQSLHFFSIPIKSSGRVAGNQGQGRSGSTASVRSFCFPGSPPRPRLPPAPETPITPQAQTRPVCRR